MKKSFIGVVTCLALFLAVVRAQDNKSSSGDAEGPQIGQSAPDFELPWADQAGVHTAKGEWIKLSALRGSNVILAFYVADWTGG